MLSLDNISNDFVRKYFLFVCYHYQYLPLFRKYHDSVEFYYVFIRHTSQWCNIFECSLYFHNFFLVNGNDEILDCKTLADAKMLLTNETEKTNERQRRKMNRDKNGKESTFVYVKEHDSNFQSV